VKGDARLTFGVENGQGKGESAIRRSGADAFEDEDDDEYEGDGSRVVWRSLITFGYSDEVQVPHRKSLEG
jgi:hypothetical protein